MCVCESSKRIIFEEKSRISESEQLLGDVCVRLFVFVRKIWEKLQKLQKELSKKLKKAPRWEKAFLEIIRIGFIVTFPDFEKDPVNDSGDNAASDGADPVHLMELSGVIIVAI